MLDLSDVRLDQLDALAASPNCDCREGSEVTLRHGDQYLQRLLQTRITPHVQNVEAFESLQRRDGVIDHLGKAWILDAVLQLRKVGLSCLARVLSIGAPAC